MTDYHAVGLTNVPTISNLAFATGGVGGADLLMTFNLKVDGVNATTFNGIANDYRFYVDVNDVGTRTDLSDSGTTATLSGGTGGNYTITIAGGAAAYGTVNSRYAIRVQTAAGSSGPRAYVVGDWPAAAQDPNMVSPGTCSNCHGPVGQGMHRSSPLNGLTCSVCHDAPAALGDGDPDPADDYWPAFKYMPMAHGIHNSELMPGGMYMSGGEEWEVTFPTYMSNCSICHDTPAALAKANAMPVTSENCFSCHGDMTGGKANEVTGLGIWEELFEANDLTFHNNFNATTDCSDCHNDTDNVARYAVAQFHNGIETERVGIIWDGQDLSITEGDLFTWQITGVTDNAAANTLTVTWTATYDGGAVDPCNSDVDAGPVFHNFPTGTVIDGRPGLLVSYMQGNDYVLGQSTTSGPGQPNNTNLTGSANVAAGATPNTTCAGNVATTTIARGTVPAGATVAMVALQGKPGLPLPTGFDNPAYPYTYMYVRVPTPTYQYVVGTGAASSDVRRTIVDTEKCLKCHVGSLYQHGNTRVDNTLMCTICHNSASSEQNIRYGMGVDASEAYDGLVGQTYELKTFLHRVHTAGARAPVPPGSPEGTLGEPIQPPLVIYRNRGIYAWAAETAVIPNWDATLAQTPCGVSEEGPAYKYQVYGALPYSAGPPAVNPNSCQTFNFFAPTYPRVFNDCTACHNDASGSARNTPEQSQAVATTLNAGAPLVPVTPPATGNWINQIDDTLQGASAAACTSCHTSTDAKGHAYQNGWVPQTFEDGRQTIIDTQ